ncbi:MAG: hypothetical protein ACXWQO_05230 [Bdellovibrionota bacterium]
MKAFYYSIILMAITTSAMAMGGKKQDEPALPTGLVNSLGSNVAAQALDPGLAFANWCQTKLGRLSTDQAQCVTQLSYRYSKKPHSELWSTNVKVASNDSVDVIASGSPVILVGMNEGPAKSIETASFIPGIEGTLAFSSPGKGKKYSVTQVSVRRCFEVSGKSVLCSEGEKTAANFRARTGDTKRRKRAAAITLRRLAS